MKTKLLFFFLIGYSLCMSANGVNINWVYYILNDSTMTATVTYPGNAPSDDDRYYNNIIIPDTVQLTKDGNKYVVPEIGTNAFYGATCGRIILPNTITKIGSWAFCGNAYLDSVVIPNSVTELGRGAFYYCRGLKKISLSNELKEIRDETFMECPKLDSIILPEKITKIGSYAFFEDSLLKYVYLPSEIDSIKDHAFQACKSISHIDLPQNIKFIGRYAFGSCHNLESISLPEGLIDLERRAFDNCRKLRYLNIPKSVKRIGTWVTNKCDSLVNIQYDAISCLLDKEGALKDEFAPFNRTSGAKLTTLSIGNNVINIPEYLGYTLRGDIMLPPTLRSVGKCAFNKFTILNDTLPSTLQEISYRAFAECIFPNGLVISNDVDLGIGAFCFIRSNTIKLPSNLQTIPDSAFFRARNMKDIDISAPFDNEHMVNMLDIPNSVTTIGKAALSGRLITLGSNVTSLGEGVFPLFSTKKGYDSNTNHYYALPNDITIVSYAEEPPTLSFSEAELNSTSSISVVCYVPHGSINKYAKGASIWKYFILEEIEKGGTITYNTNNTITLHILLDSTDNIFVYLLKIIKTGYTIHEYVFDSSGNLIAQPETIINQAPKHARQGCPEINLELEDLELGEEYSYALMAFDEDMNLVQILADKFLPSAVATSIDNAQNYNSIPKKYIENGNIYILMPNGQKYSIIGELVK